MADTGAVKSIAEHWDLLWYLLVIVVGGAIAELRFAFHNMCKEQKKFIELHNQCQKDLPEKFPSRKEFEKLEADRTKRWDKFFFPHTHHPTGEVKIPIIRED